MSVRERILIIRLLDKIAGHPMYAAVLGIECAQKTIRSDKMEKPS